MRTLFGFSQGTLLLGVLGLSLAVAIVLAVAVARNPLLLRLAWRNVPRRPGFAALITLGLSLGTVILSSAFTTGDTMSQSVRGLVSGVLGSADEVVFVASRNQPRGFDLAQAIASGTLLTGATDPLPESDVQRVRDVLGDDDRVAGVLPVLLEQKPVAGPARDFRASVNLFGVATDLPGGVGTLHEQDGGAALSLADLADDEVYANAEAASQLGAGPGDTLRIFGLYSASPDAAVQVSVRAVTRLGDVGGAQSTLYLPLARLQALAGLSGQVNQVMVVNRGTAEQRLDASWPLTVKLRAAFLDDARAERLFRTFSAPAVRQQIGSALRFDPYAGRLREKLRAFEASLGAGAPTSEFKALVQDPEVLGRLASAVPGQVRRGRGSPFNATLAGGAGSLQVLDVQDLAQDQADRWGSAFTDLFVVLGLFSLFSGLLLIVLVFSLLALERRGELGVTRALGGRRRDVVLLLALEGGLYSLLSSLFGLVGGVALALAIVSLASGLVRQYGFRLEPTVEPTSIAAAFGIGVVLTFVTVTATAWRSSRFSIVTAVRDLPDPPPGPPGWRSLLAACLPAAVGVPLLLLGLRQTWSLAYAAGVALAIVGGALLARWALRRLGAPGPERVVFTLAGAALVAWWSVPADWLRAARLPVFPSVLEMSFLGGVAMLLGAVWLIAYNVGLLRRLRGRLPLWRLSTAYVAAHRFRTGMTLAMFGLVVLGLTLGAVLLTVTNTAFADPAVLTGGWDIRADSSQPLRELRSEVDSGGTVPPDVLAGVGGTATLQAEAIQPGARGARWRSVSVMEVDQGFTRGVGAALVGGDPRSAWKTLSSQPGTAIVGAALLGQSTVVNGLRVEAAEGSSFRPFTIWLRDPRGGQSAVRVEVIGLADARGPFGNAVLVGTQTLAGWPLPESATYFISARPGASVVELAQGLNLSAPDLRATPIGEQLRLVLGVRGLLSLILQGFMGVGLVAGVAALGVLSTRAVVERRREMGVLRALGFSARAVGAGLLVESLLVALLGAGLGVGVGLFVARGTVIYLSRLNPGLRFGIPWDQVGLVVLAAVAASLLMTLLPARQAARLTPAEALREA